MDHLNTTHYLKLTDVYRTLSNNCSKQIPLKGASALNKVEHNKGP